MEFGGDPVEDRNPMMSLRVWMLSTDFHFRNRTSLVFCGYWKKCLETISGMKNDKNASNIGNG